MQKEKSVGGWKLPNSHHVTALFIGGNKEKLKSEIYENWEDGQEIDVDVRALIYVPDKLIAGVCFPKT
jgi:hypothetical protein